MRTHLSDLKDSCKDIEMAKEKVAEQVSAIQSRNEYKRTMRGRGIESGRKGMEILLTSEEDSLWVVE